MPALSADELAWLATLDDVESRLVFTEQKGNRTLYRVEHGPFDEESLGALPPENWTLLVQDVEKHLPELRRYLLEASFIPDWRMDDLMVSFASPGGSVGPHRDNYDVFLCQGTGRREWRMAPVNASLKKIESDGLSLLEPFADSNPISAGNGDVFYLPPGIAHWGIATEACITYSIGMRAPQASEFDAAVARLRDNAGTEIHDNDDRFYSDPELTVSEAEPGLISDRAIERARSCFAAAANLGDDDVAQLFGSVVTDVKAWLAPEAPSAAEVDAFLISSSGMSNIRVHGMARLAFFYGEHEGIVFANGFSETTSAPQLEIFRRLCANRVVQGCEIQSAMKNVEASQLFRWLISKGVFDLQSDGQNDAA